MKTITVRTVRKICAALILLILLPAVAPATPALEQKYSLSQPDGYSFEAYKRGDEFMNWYESASDKYPILRDGGGRWLFALPAATGGLEASGTEYREGATPPDGAVPAWRPDEKYTSALRLAAGMKSSMRSAAATEITWESHPVKGRREAVFIKATFLDSPSLSSSSADIYEMVFGDEGSVRRYYLDQSYGELEITPAVFNGVEHGVIELTLTSADFNEGKHPDWLLKKDKVGGMYKAHKNEVAFVTAMLKKTGLDFSPFDKNNDKEITADELVVYFVLDGYEESGSDNTPSAWMHAWESWGDVRGYKDESGHDLNNNEHNVILSGDMEDMTKPYLALMRWSLTGEIISLNYDDVLLPLVGGIAHELGHQICGLPDLYDVSYRNEGLGSFSLMAAGNWGRRKGFVPGERPVNLDAWSRKYLGWETPRTVVSEGGLQGISLGLPRNGKYPPVRINSAIVDSTSEYLLAEVRSPLADDWDGGLGGLMSDTAPELFKGGLYIQHIDERSGSGALDLGNDFNDSENTAHQGNMALWPDGDSRSENPGRDGYKSLWYEGNGALPRAIYFYGSKDAVSADKEAGIVLRSVSASNGEMTLSVSNSSGSSNGCSAALFPAAALLCLLALPLLRRGKKR
ncbi:MAG: hypothetical protein Q4D58_08480 [Synergistaceae bacterium]|nr:hypothetical protein [Synergistaceae bacterium]